MHGAFVIPPDTQQELVEFARQLVRIKSLSGQEGEVLRFVEQRMLALGYDQVVYDGMGNLLGRVGDGPRSIMFDSHVDTVDVTDAEQWELAAVQRRRRGRAAVWPRLRRYESIGRRQRLRGRARQGRRADGGQERSTSRAASSKRTATARTSSTSSTSFSSGRTTSSSASRPPTRSRSVTRARRRLPSRRTAFPHTARRPRRASTPSTRWPRLSSGWNGPTWS